MKYSVLLLFYLITGMQLFGQKQIHPYEVRATYYHNMFEGRTTTSGHIFLQEGYTAAHKNLPLGTLAKVVNPKNNRWVIVKINDRCPKNGILDLSEASAKQLGFIHEGIIPVEVWFLPPSLFSLWEFQNIIFSVYPDCSFNEWERFIYILTGTTDLSKKEYSKDLIKAKKKKIKKK